MLSQLETICLTNLENQLKYQGEVRPTIVGRTAFQERVAQIRQATDALSERVSFAELAQNATGLGSGFLAYVLPALFQAAGQAEGFGAIACDEERRSIRHLFAEYRTCYMSNLFLVTRYFARWFFSALELRQPSLEIGTEDGVTTKIALVDRKVTVGSNPSMPELLEARQRNACREYVSLDAMKIPFAADVFQTALLIYTFYHIEDRRRVLREVGRVLAPGGTVAFIDTTPRLAADFPVPRMLEMFGFRVLAQEMEAQWFSRYDGNRQLIPEEAYPACLDELGYELVTLERFMSKKVTSYAYFAYLLDNIFNTNSYVRLPAPAAEEFLLEIADEVLAPMLAMDAQWCAGEGSGSYLFVVARKKGQARTPVAERHVLNHLQCPRDGSPLRREGNVYRSAQGTVYPIVNGVPLLIPFYADWYEKHGGALPTAAA